MVNNRFWRRSSLINGVGTARATHNPHFSFVWGEAGNWSTIYPSIHREIESAKDVGDATTATSIRNSEDWAKERKEYARHSHTHKISINASLVSIGVSETSVRACVYLSSSTMAN
jgi:hypothetical protein